ncbi:MAG: ATP-binding protein, partial [Chloroflexota bacterium]
EIKTLDSIVASLSARVSASRAYLGLKDGNGVLMPVSTIGIDPGEHVSPGHEALDQPVLRSAAKDADRQALHLFPWAEIVMPVKLRDEQLGVLALSRPGIDGYFNAKQVSFLSQAAGVLAVAAENITLFETARKLSWQRLSIQDEERRELSRQIHDEPLQRITYATFLIDQLLTRHFQASDEVGQAKKGEPIGESAASKLVFTADQLRKAAKSLREVCTGLHPPFHDQGVEFAVRDVISTFESEYGLNIHYEASPGALNYASSEQVTGAISRVLKEALNNVRKHAKGADAWVSLDMNSDNVLVLTVADNGPGIPVDQFSFSELVRRHHLGIAGMHEWAQQVGGDLKILPNTPRGTRVVFSYQCQ